MSAIESVEETLSIVDTVLVSESLNNLQELIIRYCWEGQTYAQIAEITGYDDDYIRDAGFKLWRQLSHKLGKKVSKSNFKTVLRRHHGELHTVNSQIPSPSCCLTDWSTAADVPHFYGRDRELATLTQWVIGDRCRLINLLGMGGIGKSALAIHLAQTLQPQFEILIWRSLKFAPPLNDLLNSLLNVLAPSPDTPNPDSLSGKLEHLIQILRAKRCLVILDNLDVLLESGQNCGTFQPAHQAYGDMLQAIGEIAHASSILITSREKPQGLDGLEGDRCPVRTLYLQGLDPNASQQVLDSKGLTGTVPDLHRLIDYYRGHPLALQIISTSIHELFDGDIAQFFQQGYGVFNGLQKLLACQLQRLSSLECAILYWLTLNGEPICIEQLKDNLVPEPPTATLLEALESLRRRSLIEITKTTLALGRAEGQDQAVAFTLQPAIMECLVDTLIRDLCAEIKALTPHYFLSHSLLQAQAPENLRDSQTRFILAPLANQLRERFGSDHALIDHLQTLLKHLQTLPPHQMGYGGGNLLNLYRHLKTDLTGYDFSGLTLRQALLHDVSLRRTNFTQATFSQCSFANTFGGITHLAFSPDGSRFATCDSNGNVAIWSVAGMHPIAQCVGHDFWTWAVAFHPNGLLLASCGQDQTIRLWDTATGHCHQILQGHTNIVTEVTFSPDGLSLLSCSTDSSIKQWDLATGTCVQTLVGHETCVWGVVFAPDGQHCYSGGEDNRLRYWNLRTGACLQVLTGHTQWIMAIALSADGCYLASASIDHTIKLWCTTTGNCLQTLSGHQAPVFSVAFSPDGHTLASGSYDQTLRLWDVHSGACTHRLKKHTNRIWCVKFHPSGTLLASGGDDHTTRFWNAHTGDSTTTLQGHSNGIYAIALHPHAPLLASAHEDQTVRLWPLPLTIQASNDADPIEPMQTLRGHQNRILAIAFSPDGQTLASGSLDRTIKLWSPDTAQCRLTLHGHTSWIWAIAFHPNCKTLASASYDRTVKLWNIETGHCTHTLEGHRGSALSVGFSPDGQWLASGGYEQMLKLWHPQSGECVRTWYAHANRIWAVAFSPNSQWLATAGEDSQIILWDLETGDRLQILSGHQQPVLSIRFSADGRQLFSSSADRTLKQWDLDSGNCLQTFCGHQHWVWDLALVAPNLLFSGSQDERIQGWDLQTGQVTHRLEVPRPYTGMNIANVRGLTAAQCQTLKVLGAVVGC
ncbi:MAG: NB-ARC domain-containing protein [Thermosynechococcaceae cyanobacterium]